MYDTRILTHSPHDAECFKHVFLIKTLMTITNFVNFNTSLFHKNYVNGYTHLTKGGFLSCK